MRPVERGPEPTEAPGWKNYREAYWHLEHAFGNYCSYCEMQLPTSLAVEHIQPKSLKPELALAWGNFLLGCTHCNSVKNNKQVDPTMYLWPDQDNTARAFEYGEAGVISISPTLDPAVDPLAQATNELVGLLRDPATGATEADKRWFRRRETYDRAVTSRARLDRAVEPGRDALMEQIADTACVSGFFSVWMSVFEGEPTMRKLLLAAFRGTADCFDADTHPVPRLGGRC